jgi:oligoendopeptidase F
VVDPELEEVWNNMIDFGLYDIEPRGGKSTSSEYCTNLSGYDAPFIFTYWEDDFRSTTTLVHEFGHFYDFWLHYDTSSSNLDIAEVYSQGLELLMYPLYDTLVDYAEEAELDNLQSMLINVLIYQCALEDFQLRLYELDTFDADVLGSLFGEVLKDYGLGAGGSDGSWMEVWHVFGAPFYTISYVTSLIAALQIWAISQDNWETGVETYLDLIHADQQQPFTALLESVGLAPVHRRGTLQQIAAHYKEVFSA